MVEYFRLSLLHGLKNTPDGLISDDLFIGGVII